MTADAKIYASERMAAAYAFTRPPVHRHIVERMSRYVAQEWPVDAALDIGCGAGASTAALAPLAKRRVGLERYASMLKHSGAIAPGAEFHVGCAEALPFAAHAFDLVTAAGVLNYTDVEASLAEVARVMSVQGVFVPYDFSGGRRLREDARLGEWHKDFCLRFPSTPGYSLDLRALNYASHGLALEAYEEFEVEIPMSLAQCVNSMAGDSRVENALSERQSESEIKACIEDSLRPVFCESRLEVIFEAQIAFVRKSRR